MPNYARFTINDDPSTNGAYSASALQNLACKLENSPGGVAFLTTFEVYDPGNPGSPLASKDAPQLTFYTATTSGSKVNTDTPAGEAVLQAPASGIHSWVVRCSVNGGLNGRGAPDPDFVFERMIVMRAPGFGMRKEVYSEGTSASQRGAADAQNEIVEQIAQLPTGGSGASDLVITCDAGVDNIDVSNPGTDTFDGFQIEEGQTLFVAHPNDSANSGPWIFQGSGSAMERPEYFDSIADTVRGAQFVIANGNVFRGAVYVLLSDSPVGPKTWLANPHRIFSGSLLSLGDFTSFEIPVAVGTLLEVRARVVAIDEGGGADRSIHTRRALFWNESGTPIASASHAETIDAGHAPFVTVTLTPGASKVTVRVEATQGTVGYKGAVWIERAPI